MKKRLVTSALPYVNNTPHLGNLIQVLSADVFARFCRQRGYSTLYVCGSDEYGTATETRAQQEGISPKELCDRFYHIHKEIYDWFGIAFDHFGRTSCAEQTEIVQDIYHAVAANGYIQQREVEQMYCLHCQRFLADRFVHGCCPRCGGKNARGDQCEDCGAVLDPTDLLQPRCGVCGTAPERRRSEHLFLDLPALKEILETWMAQASAHGRWAKNALQMTKSWIHHGLAQRCITRDLSWGVPVPGMPGKVFYVWFDAPIGYMAITAALLKQRGGDWKANWRSWWQNPQEVELFQFIGKDNIPFHTVLFPCSLLAAGQGQQDHSWTMLHHLSSSEYLNYEGGKFSKTRGVGIFGSDCRKTGIPADCWRFYLYYNRPERGDYQFTWAEFQQLINRELIGNLGNLVYRTLHFVQRFFDGQLLPEAQVRAAAPVAAFLARLPQYCEQIAGKLEWGQLKDGLHQLLELSAYGNKSFQESEPWKLVKQERELAHAWLSALAFCIHDLAICLRPYLPQTAARIAAFLGQEHVGGEDLADGEPCSPFCWRQLGCYQQLSLQPLPKPELLFPRLENKQISELRQRFAGKQEAEGQPAEKSAEPVAGKARNWAESVDLRVGKIIAVEPHPNAERLFVERIDCGAAEPRTIVSGLAAHYRPEELLGKNVAVVANLKPSKLRGIRSMGMILAASALAAGKSQLEVLHPAGQPGDRIVVGGFADLPPPQKRLSIQQFQAVPLFLHGGKAYLQDDEAPKAQPGQDAGLALLVQTASGSVELVCSQLQSGDIA